MNDLDLAMAEFLAKNAPVICAPVLTAKQSIELAAASYKARIENERHLGVVHNAENRRYDSEGFYYVGGVK